MIPNLAAAASYGLALSEPLPDPPRAALAEALAALGDCVQIYDAFWVLRTPLSAELVEAEILRHLPLSIRGVLFRISNREAYLHECDPGEAFVWP